jgi:hypothetical protein
MIPKIAEGCLFAALMLWAAAAAAVPTTLVIEGDEIAGIGVVTTIDNMTINGSGAWFVELDTNFSDTDADSLILGAAGAIFREGQPLASPAGALLDSFDSMSVNEDGVLSTNWFLDNTGGTSNDSGVFASGELVLQESELGTAPPFTPETPFIGFFETKVNDAGQVLILGSIDDPLVASTVDRVLAIYEQTDPIAGTWSATGIVAIEGQVLPGQTEAVADIQTDANEFAFNDNGDVAWFVDLAGDTAVDTALYLNDTLLFQEGSPSPVTDRAWGPLTTVGVDLNNQGQWIARGQLAGDAATNLIIVAGDQVIAQEGDPVPGQPEFALTNLGTNVQIDDLGRTLWWGEWSAGPTLANSGLFLDGQPLVVEGVTVIDGLLVEKLYGGGDNFELSDNGKHLIFEADLEGGLNGAFHLELEVPGCTDGEPCDDGLVCTSGDTCTGGECLGTPIECDDGTGCTDDACVEAIGCVNMPNDALCDDLDPCTIDTCTAEGCTHAPDPGCLLECSVDGDLDQSGTNDVVDVQCAIVTVLWNLNGADPGAVPGCLDSAPTATDVNCDASIDVTDITLIIQFALGAPLDPAIDSDQDGCHDACEF